MTTDDETTQATAKILGHYRKEKKSLIPILQEVQTKLGYLPREALQQVAQLLGMGAV